MGGRRARQVHNRKVILATKKTPNRKFSTLTVAAAGCAVAVAAIASGAATSAAAAASATGPAGAAGAA